ncbi:hypothetical protein GCM10023189_22410 [Nibrella saemangeumensis]|uniref:Uncharacterized protein n=1 Tax=Nibrella saemangeumensis TaxID=1084526 RepID=A0ABP8MVK0_9BACT
MKNQLILAGVATLFMSLAGAFTATIRPDEPAPGIVYSSLLLNGKPLEIATFSRYSRGILRLAVGNAVAAEAVDVPFRVYLQRNGRVVPIGQSDSNQTLYEVDLYPVLSLAVPGDELVIDPVRPADKAAKRVLRVHINWLVLKGDGC